MDDSVNERQVVSTQIKSQKHAIVRHCFLELEVDDSLDCWGLDQSFILAHLEEQLAHIQVVELEHAKFILAIF